MQKIVLDENDDPFSLSEKIAASNDAELCVVVGDGHFYIKSPISLRLLEKYGESLGKKVSFESSDSTPIKLEPVAEDEKSSFNFSDGGDVNLHAKLWGPKHSLLIFVLIPVALILIGGCAFSLWWFVPSANVSIKLNSEVLVKNVGVSADVSATSVNKSDKVIPAVLLESVRKESDSIQTTGEEEVGDKASGTVKIYNKTGSKKTFSKGTKLTLDSSNDEGINFLLDEDVTVEEQDSVNGTYGFSEAKVVAENFGSKYNLSADQQFKIDDNKTDDFVARNDSSFSGGTSMIVPAVTQKDMDSLKQNLESKLKESSKVDLGTKLVSGQKIAGNSINYEVLSSDFDKNVGDEAGNLSLTMQVKSYTLAYYEKDLDPLIQSVIDRAVPEKYSITGGETKFDIGDVVAEDPTPVTKDKVDLLVKVKSYVVPKINSDDIKANLIGKNLDLAKGYLNSLSDLQSYEITVWPELPAFLNVMPHVKSRINVSVQDL